MKIECNLEKLRNSISLTERVTGKNLTLPILGSILLIASGKSLKMRATNLNIGIEIERRSCSCFWKCIIKCFF